MTLDTALNRIDVITKIKEVVLRHLDIHMSFESISNVVKLKISKACDAALNLFQNFKAKNQKEYDVMIDWQYEFVKQILSVPTIVKYIRLPKINCKNLLASYYFVQASIDNSQP